MKHRTFFALHVASLCDADKRNTHSGTAFVSRIASVHSMHEVYIKRNRRFHRIAQRLVKR